MELNEKQKKAREMVCLPLDGIDSMKDLRARVEELSPVVGLFKIGKETFTRFGPKAVEAVQEYNANVFLDLKYHDIPNTVKGAAKAASQLGVYMFNVHASGGHHMMLAARDGAREGAEECGTEVPKVLAVTVLTSIDQKVMNEQLRVPGKVEEHVLHYARWAIQAQLDGIVCSAADLYAVKDKIADNNFMYVTPGIKGPNTPAGADQKRVFTPGNAVQDGASILVIGRAITGPKTPEERIQAGYDVLKDMEKYL